MTRFAVSSNAVEMTALDKIKFDYIQANFSGDISETARRLCMNRRTLQRIIRRAERAGVRLKGEKSP